MKAFVLKNNKGLYYTSHLNDEEIHTEDISVANIFNREIADSVKLFLNKTTYRYGGKWEVVEITIEEGDLLQKIGELKDYIYSYNNETNNRPQICNEYIDATCKDIIEKIKELKL